MRGAESVVYIQIGIGSQRLGEVGIVLLFFSMEAQVFQQQHLAGLERGGLGLGVFADYVLGHDHFLSQQLAQALGDGSQGQLGHILSGLLEGLLGGGLLLLGGQVGNLGQLLLVQLELGVQHIVGLAHMGAQDHGRAVAEQILDGRQRADDAVFIGDLGAGFLVHGHVEVHADKHFFALYVYVFDGLFHNHSPF